MEVLREQESSRKIDLRLVYEAFKYTCVTQKLIKYSQTLLNGLDLASKKRRTADRCFTGFTSQEVVLFLTTFFKRFKVAHFNQFILVKSTLMTQII